jgi:hypothetical protein
MADDDRLPALLKAWRTLVSIWSRTPGVAR